jgi:hypothetical protein
MVLTLSQAADCCKLGRLVAPRQHITLQSASIASALRRADEVIE